MDREHVIYSWSAQAGLDPLRVAGGEGCWFWDDQGRRYLDFASQVVNLNLGHQHPRLVEAVRRQADTLCGLAPSFASEPRSELARLLAEVTPGDLGMTLFTTGGADANENAVKLARWVTGRQKVVARYRSYHGATAGAAALTGDPRRWPAEPAVPGVVRMFDPYPYRCSAGTSTTARRHADPPPATPTTAPSAPAVRTWRRSCRSRGPSRSPPCSSRPSPAPTACSCRRRGYLASIREVCDRHGILLILDEVMTGFGRTGRWFGCEHWDVVPDIMTLAKGISGGAAPLGAMVVSEKLRPWLEEHEFASGLTACGHPLACAAGVATIEVHARRAAGGERRGDGPRSSPRSCPSSPTTTRRSARYAASACSGVSSWCATARPASRWCPTRRGVRPRRRWRRSGAPPSTAACTCTRTGTCCWSRLRSSSGATRSPRAWGSSTRC